MKKNLIIIVILLLVGAGYFTYEKWIKHANLTTWSFVPADAALVYEANLLSDFNELSPFGIWANPGIKHIQKRIAFLDSINGDGGFSAIFKTIPSLITVQRISSASFDFLFIADVQNLSQNTFISVVIARLKEAGYKFKTRNYNGFTISEIGKGYETLTYILYKNFFLASFTPYLVEDAIRAINNDGITSFHEAFPETFSVAANNSAGSLYVNFNQTENLISAFFNKKMSIPLISGFFEFSIDPHFINYSGFSFPDQEWISPFEDMPASFEMAEIIPSNAAIVYHVTSSDFSNWKVKQEEYLKASDKIAWAHKNLLLSSFDFNTTQVFDLLADEISLINLESDRSDTDYKLLVCKVKDMNESLQFFQQISKQVAYSKDDSVHTEDYSENEIRFLAIKDFPMTLLGQLASGFDQCFYKNIRNYLVFSNDLQSLKDLIDLIEAEDTWGKSVRINNFLERTNQEANISLFINTPRAWTKIQSNIRPEWKSYFEMNKHSYQSVELIAFQLSYIGNHYFTNLTLTQPEQKPRVISKTSADNSLTLKNTVISKPFLLRTHKHQNLDILLQDDSYMIYFLDLTLATQWSEQLDERLISDIYEIDYYRNGKIQYAFATETKIHIIDRTGTYIPGFPKSLPNSPQLDHFNVIDYSKSGEYRYGIIDADGKVFLTNKYLNLLEGWDPIPYKRAAIQPLHHARLGGRDVMISVQEDGIINLTNRRGERSPGFPFDLDTPIDTRYFLTSSNSLEKSSLTFVSKTGELIEINLDGQVRNKTQLIKNEQDAAFMLVPDSGEKSFILIRKEGSSYSILGADGNFLFEKDHLSESSILIQYYRFGTGKDMIVFTDTDNEGLYIYDRSGNLITDNPLKSGHEISIVYSSSRKEFNVYATSGSNLEIFTFQY